VFLAIHALVQFTARIATGVHWTMVTITKPVSPSRVTILYVCRTTIAESLCIVFVDVAKQPTIDDLQAI